MKASEITGLRFGRLLVIARAGSKKHKHGARALWLCRCDCGQEKIVCGQALRRKNTASCGCLSLELANARIQIIKYSNRTHGMARTPTWRSWDHMLQRCENPKNDRYRNYGGRGICVCAAWHSFESFFRDMGTRPTGKTIERINNNGNYEPVNCRWATSKEQANNTRTNHLLQYEGRTQTISAWEQEVGASPNSIRSRLQRGWMPERAITTPVSNHQPNKT